MPKVAIIGAGVAGLTAANYLHKAKIAFIVFEASDKPGGKLQTEIVEGFTLDKGFQVFLTAYPEAKAFLNYKTLKLKHFNSGALIRLQKRFVEVNDPLRQPGKILSGLTAPIGNLLDKLKILQLSTSLKRLSIEEIFNTPEQSTFNDLKQLGFSNKIIERFFKPFLGGIFLERQLATSNRMFRFVMKMFAEGAAALPSGGIIKIAEQLAQNLPKEKIEYKKKVNGIEKGKVLFENEDSQSFDYIISSVDFEKDNTQQYNAVCNLYFAATLPAVKGKKLILNGNGSGLVNNVVFVDEIDPSVAPEGKSLVSVSVIGQPNLSDEKLTKAVQEELAEWFGMAAKTWKHLKTYRIEKALPFCAHINKSITPVENNGIINVGDQFTFGSLNAAMESARKAAGYVQAKLNNH